MNGTERRDPGRKTVIGVILYAVLFFLIVALSNLDAINRFLAKVLDVLAPVLLGLCIAYLINPLFRIFERRVFSRIGSVSLRRTLSLLPTYLVVLALIAGLILLIIPQLIESVKTFAGNFEAHLDSLVNQLNAVIAWINNRVPSADGSPVIDPLDRATVLEKVNGLWGSLMQLIRDNMENGNISKIFAILGQTASAVTDIILAVFISLYVLATKELRYAQIIRFRVACVPESVNRILTRILTIADRSFGGFLRGKLLDSTIVGILVYLFCRIAQVPNALLVAVIVGITDIIPVIGPFIGVIPSAVIILLTDPIKVIFFLVAILVIQQIDGTSSLPRSWVKTPRFLALRHDCHHPHGLAVGTGRHDCRRSAVCNGAGTAENMDQPAPVRKGTAERNGELLRPRRALRNTGVRARHQTETKQAQSRSRGGGYRRSGNPHLRGTSAAGNLLACSAARSADVARPGGAEPVRCG